MLRRGFIGLLPSVFALTSLSKNDLEPKRSSVPYDDKNNSVDLRQQLVDWTAYQKPLNKALGVLHFYGDFPLKDCDKIRKDICKHKKDKVEKWALQFYANAIKNQRCGSEAVLIWQCLLVSFRCPRTDGFEVLDSNELYDTICILKMGV